MDFHFLYDGQRFVWDIEKASANARKHGVNFETACLVFFDPFFVIDDASANGEKREAAIGYCEDSWLLFVVHMTRTDDTIRIISAREATLQERRIYEDNE